MFSFLVNVGLTVGDIFKFITGSKSLPPLGLPNKLTVLFKHDCVKDCRCRPTASTCALSMTIPVHIKTDEEMLEMILSAVKEGLGFGNV